jgi:hypothetical protein
VVSKSGALVGVHGLIVRFGVEIICKMFLLPARAMERVAASLRIILSETVLNAPCRLPRIAT